MTKENSNIHLLRTSRKMPPNKAVKAAISMTQPQLRPPRWISAKDTRATAAEVHAQNIKTAKSLPLETAVDDLASLYGTEAYVAVIETSLREYAAKLLENGRPCEFSEGIYAALLTMLFTQSATTAATFHWAGNQRRLLEQRVEALESQLDGRGG